MNSRYRAIVYYPPCLGGNWLSSTIHGLETNGSLPSGENYIFDQNKNSLQVLCTHLLDFEKWSNDPAGVPDEDHYLFSSPRPYFHFCQRAYKGYLNSAHGLYTKSEKIGEQALALIDVGKYLLFNKDFSRYYNDIDLNYDWIFYDQDKFIDHFIEILYRYNIKIDREFILRSVDIYKENSLDPTKIIGNVNDVVWLSWCLLWLEQQHVELDFQIQNLTSIKELAKNLERYQNSCIEYTQDLCKQHQ